MVLPGHEASSITYVLSQAHNTATKSFNPE